MTNLEKLREITNKLPPFSNMIMTRSKGCLELEMTKGYCFGWNLIKTPEIAVDRWFNSCGSEFPRHIHASKEWIIVYEGEIHLTVVDKLQKFLPGQYILMEPGTPHSAYFPQDCSYITVTMPPAEGFPNGTQ